MSTLLKHLCVLIFLGLLVGCTKDESSSIPDKSVPHVERWGIYALDLSTEDVELLASSAQAYSDLRLNHPGDRFVFAQKIDGNDDQDNEICTIGTAGSSFQRLTHNEFRDIYPCWAPNDSAIAFLSWRDSDLDIYVMNADGNNPRRLYDSGFHDADIDWWGERIAFTRNSQIWSLRDDGTDADQLTDPPNAGQWGNANLPFGDYDPRWSPDGTKIVFERLEDDISPHGNYNLFSIHADGSGENRLTDTGYSQGMACWSHAGDRIIYLVAAIGTEGKYDIYMMNADGSDNRNITPSYFPPGFLCHSPLFSHDDSKIFFIGEWWE